MTLNFGLLNFLLNLLVNFHMYVGVTTAVRMKGEESKEFEVKVHQGCVFSPLLFTIVLEALSRHLRKGLP